MDTRLLKHYEAELAYMREMGAEFAAAYPKIANRLGMDGLEVADPYVERLLESFAFLAARVQLELEMQAPELSQNLLEILYPHFMAPRPSMMIAHLEPDAMNADFTGGYTLPRHSQLRSGASGQRKSCIFRTAHDVQIWPLVVSEAEYIGSRGDLVALGLAHNPDARAAIRLKFRRMDGGKVSELPIRALTLHLNREPGGNWALHEALCNAVAGLDGRAGDKLVRLPEGRVDAKGFAPEEAMLPVPDRSLDGYRLLQEYFALPERFHFVDISGLEPVVRAAGKSEFELFLYLDDTLRGGDSMVVPEAFMLNAVPAVNLFEKRCDRVRVTDTDTELRVVAERTATNDFEIFDLLSVVGIGRSGAEEVEFRPFFSQSDLTSAGDVHTAFYTKTRRMRQRSEKERLQGARTSYLGSEMYITIVDRDMAPFDPEVDQLAVRALCTNRDLPLLLSTGDDATFTLPDGGPVTRITTPVPPTRPRPTIAQGRATWQLISNLSLNYLSITDGPTGGGSEALRELIGVYGPSGDRAIAKQLEGIIGVTSRPIVRRLSDEVLSTAVRGLEIELRMDDDFFQGASAYLLATVLERIFRRHVSMNSFTETVLTTQQRGEVARWKARNGLGHLI